MRHHTYGYGKFIDRRRKARKVQIAFVLTCVLVGGALGVATARADDSIQVTASIRPAVAASVMDGGIVVHSNTSWDLQAQLVDGQSRTQRATGGPTGSAGAFVPAEGDVACFTLVAGS